MYTKARELRFCNVDSRAFLEEGIHLYLFDFSHRIDYAEETNGQLRKELAVTLLFRVSANYDDENMLSLETHQKTPIWD